MSDTSPSAGPPPSPELDTNRAHMARVWNYWLGGKTTTTPTRRPAYLNSALLGASPESGSRGAI